MSCNLWFLSFCLLLFFAVFFFRCCFPPFPSYLFLTLSPQTELIRTLNYLYSDVEEKGKKEREGRVFASSRVRRPLLRTPCWCYSRPSTPPPFSLFAFSPLQYIICAGWYEAATRRTDRRSGGGDGDADADASSFDSLLIYVSSFSEFLSLLCKEKKWEEKG